MGLLSCGYRNGTDRMVIVRCLGPEEFFLERVVFPFELLSFLAPRETVVQIWTHGLGGAELVESLNAAELGEEQELDPEPEAAQEPDARTEGTARSTAGRGGESGGLGLAPEPAGCRSLEPARWLHAG
ncbi:DUF1830 domain-containing protein [Vulcanococcus limneticus]|uniref:DUF1830 domain-containing protein n=1 Tax=Vulcanococcus limneticus TaxID=2170428 RepID=UPI00398C1D1D